MADAIKINPDADEGNLVEPPIVDSLRFDSRQHTWVITFIPENSVSTREKEIVSIPRTTSDGQRINLRVHRLSQLLGLEVREVVHGGDGNFAFISDNGIRRDLPEPHATRDLSVRAYVELSDIAMTAQITFLSQRSIAAAS